MFSKVNHLEKLVSRAIFKLFLKPETPLHVGNGQEGALKQIVRLRVGDDLVPIIPSNSFKGALRSLATYLAKSMQFKSSEVDEVVRFHRKDEHLPSKIDEKYLSAASELASKLYAEDQLNELSESDKMEIYFSMNCPICLLFGSRKLAGKLLFYDLIPIVKPKVTTYTSTSMSRKIGVVEGERLFSAEMIPPQEGLYFETRVVIDNLDNGSSEARLFAKVLEYILTNGLYVGGLKSKGFGLLTLDEENSRALILKLNPDPESDAAVKENIYALLLKEGHYDTLDVRSYIEKMK